MGEELTTIQRLLDREYHFDKRWLPANFQTDVLPLVIRLEEHLKEEGYDNKDNRRDARLELLRRITNQPNLASTKDLSAYQCKAIYGFLVDKESDDYRATEHGKALLDGLTRDLEDFGVFKEE